MIVQIISVDEFIVGIYTNVKNAEDDFEKLLKETPSSVICILKEVEKNVIRAGLWKNAEIIRLERGRLKCGQ